MKNLLITLLSVPIILWGSIGQVAALKGEATVHRSGKNILLKNGADILKKDRVTTAKNSRVQILLKDRTIITIGEKSDYVFNDYVFGKNRAKADMQARHGFFRIITGKISKIAPQRFMVKTKSATIGIRGTHFYGIVGDEYEQIGCLGGMISVKTPDRLFLLEAGKMVVWQNGNWKAMSIKAGGRGKKMLSPASDFDPHNDIMRDIFNDDPDAFGNVLNGEPDEPGEYGE
jgi:hypothetical protein